MQCCHCFNRFTSQVSLTTVDGKHGLKVTDINKVTLAQTLNIINALHGSSQYKSPNFFSLCLQDWSFMCESITRFSEVLSVQPALQASSCQKGHVHFMLMVGLIRQLLKYAPEEKRYMKTKKLKAALQHKDLLHFSAYCVPYREAKTNVMKRPKFTLHGSNKASQQQPTKQSRVGDTTAYFNPVALESKSPLRFSSFSL